MEKAPAEEELISVVVLVENRLCWEVCTLRQYHGYCINYLVIQLYDKPN